MRRIFILTLAFLIGALPALAQPRGMIMVRDTEVEELLRDYTRPIFRAAKVGEDYVEIFLVQDPSFNAFVASGRRIFINTGALTSSKTPNQMIGVLAHETGHIAGGHLARLREQLQKAQAIMIIGMLLGAGGIAAASASGQKDIGQGVMGTLMGSQNMALRSMLSYQRGEEQAADRAAISYLNATGQSSKGMIETFQRFASDSLFQSRGSDPYLFSHPMPNDRIANLTEIAKASPHYDKKDSPALQFRHDMMRAKLLGFTGRMDSIARAYPVGDSSLPAKYARAIAAYRNGNSAVGVRLTDELLASQPNNAYFHELKGQILLEMGQANAAIAPLRKSLALKPNSNLIRSMYGHALVSTGDNKFLDEAIRVLLQATARDENNAEAFTQLAIAYGRKGQMPLADLASARAAFAGGDFRTAKQIATRAKNALPANSAHWFKAEEIATFKLPQQGG